MKLIVWFLLVGAMAVLTACSPQGSLSQKQSAERYAKAYQKQGGFGPVSPTVRQRIY